MKTSAPVLVLLALLALVPCTQCLAQTPLAATPAAASSVAAAPAPAADVADFLATLSGGPSHAPATEVLPPSPRFLSTVCTSDADCPSGQLCCYPCGIDGCDFVCMTPVKGRCPLFV